MGRRTVVPVENGGWGLDGPPKFFAQGPTFRMFLPDEEGGPFACGNVPYSAASPETSIHWRIIRAYVNLGYIEFQVVQIDRKSGLESTLYVHRIDHRDLNDLESVMATSIAVGELTGELAGQALYAMFYRRFVSYCDEDSWVRTYFPRAWASWMRGMPKKNLLIRMAEAAEE